MSKLSGILFKSLSARVMSSFAKRQWLICFFFTVVSVQFTHSQLFPVQVSPQLTPPYSLKLSDYSTSTTEKLLVNLLLTDVNESDLQVRLRFSISGNSVNIQSKDFVQNAAPIQLTGGIPLRLSNLDLQPYFDLQNLNGITPSEYNKPLPDGLYQFCFEVFDWTTGRPLSEKKCYPVYLVLNDPPFLNLPQNGEQVPAQDPQNLIFQWTPRHVNATGVEYEFELRELWDTNVDPQTAFLASPNLYQTTGFANTLLYGPGETSLLEGKTYGWRVRAVVSDGISETAVFKNGGYSEIFYFTYTGKCDAPHYILAKSEGTTTEEITWQQNPDHINYQIQFRKEGGSNNVWFESETVETKKKLFFLEAETTYEYRVGGQCVQNGGYSYSAINTFTTPGKEDASEYNCGIPPEIVITNQDPLQLLGVNDVFTAGDFPVTVKEVNGGNGNYTGWGFIVVPYLGDTQIRVTFNNIQINTDKQLTNGIVETEYDEKFATTGGAGMSDVSELTELIEGDNDIDELNVNFVIPPDYFEDYITVEDGQVVIRNPNDAQVRTSPLGDDKVIVDSAGNTYHVDAEGNVTKGGKIDEGGPVNADNVEGVTKNGDIESLTAKGITVTFNSRGTYGYDKLPSGINNTKLNEEYKSIKDAQGANYEIVNHVAEKNKSSLITATVSISNSDYTIDDLIFKTKQGELLTHTKATNNTVNLSVQGRYTFENEPIYAVVKSKQDTTKQQTAGAFNLWHLSRKTVDVVLVSVNGAQLPTAIELNTIFNQAATTLNIETKSVSLTNGLLGADNKLEIGDKPWLNTYNQEQKAIIADLKQKIDYQKDKYYVFTFNSSFNTTKSIAGFMPLKRQFGFVFNGGLNSDEEGKEDLAKVTAHEVAHGIFALQHPFTTYGNDTKGKTPWLMDYANGDLLSHMDWAQIHNPNLKFYIFQDEEDGEMAPSDSNIAARFIEKVKASIVAQNKIVVNNEINYDGLTILSDGISADSIIQLSEIAILTSIQEEIELLNQSFETTDGDNIKLDLIVHGNKAFNAVGFVEVISSPSNQIKVGNKKKYFYPYAGEISSNDKKALEINDSSVPTTRGVTIMVSENNISDFEKTLIAFNKSGTAQKIWENSLNKALEDIDTEKLQKYPKSALSLTSIESRKKVFLELIDQNKLKGNNSFNNFWGVDDEETIVLTFLHSLIKENTKNDNETLFKLIVDDKWEKLDNLINADDGNNNEELFKLISLLALNIDQNLVFNKINKVGLTEIIIGEADEKLLLSLIRGIKKEQYSTLLTNLYNNENKLLKSLINNINNRSINPWDGDNYTSFLQALGAISSKLDSDQKKIDLINAFIKIRFSDLDANDANFLQTTLTSLSKNKDEPITNLGQHFVELLNNHNLSSLDNYNLVLEIAELRNKDKEIFAQFTQIEQMTWYIESQGITAKQSDNWAKNNDWLKPDRLNFFGLETKWGTSNLKGFYAWANYITNNQEIITLLDSNLPQYLTIFKEQFIEFKNSVKNSNISFWDRIDFTPKGNINVERAMSRIALKESAESLKNVNSDIKRQLVKKIFDGNFNFNDASSIENFEDSLIKLMYSFDSSDQDILRTLEEIGYNTIFEKLSGDRLTRFLMWSGTQIQSTKRWVDMTQEAIIDAAGNLKNPDDLLNLERNIWDFNNFKANKLNKTVFTVGGKPYAYNQIVPVYIEDDFTFLDKQFKRGNVITMPFIQALAMSNDNGNAVLKNSAFLAVEVASFAIGMGEIRVLFKAGHYVTKAILISDLVGSSAGIIVSSLDASAITPELRFKIQMLSMVASLPQIATSLPKVRKLVDEADVAINSLKGIPPGSRSNIGKYWDVIKVKFPGNVKSIDKLLAYVDQQGLTKLKTTLSNIDDPEKLARFADKFSELPESLAALNNKPKSAEAWFVLDDIGVDDAIKIDLENLDEVSELIGGSYKTWKTSSAGVNNRLWTNIDFTGKYYKVKFLDDVDLGVASSSYTQATKTIEFDLNVPPYLQKQGVASEIYAKGLANHPETKIIKEEYIASSRYIGGEPANLTIFKMKLKEYANVAEEAAFLTPSGKIIKKNDFDELPEILINTDKNVTIQFRKAGSAANTTDDLANVLKTKLPNLDNDLLDALKLDYPNGGLQKFIDNPDLVDSWKLLDDLPNSFVKTDINRLEIFHKLSGTNKNLIKQFTDVDANSTLSKFLDDCDDEFLQFINNPDNALEVKGFLAHKEGMLTADDNRWLSEMLNSADEIPNDKVRKWLEYGDQQAIFKANREAGNSFGNLMKTELGDASSDAYRVLKEKLSKSNLNLDDYSIYSQVQLCLKGDCLSKGNYWIPDFMLVAERTDAITGIKYLETIIVDAKLSRGTGWTKNQVVAKDMSDWSVKTINPDGLLKGTPVDGFVKEVSVAKNGDFIKIFNEGGILKTN